ncbi:putative phospholipid-binding lipoprotein mlaA precursor [Rickettsiales bacterium Ac37b]|nr:putative phospholipid-binding lipoprotein mlaA precursor [Rickettsiales bacterium Ac37b]
MRLILFLLAINLFTHFEAWGIDISSNQNQDIYNINYDDTIQTIKDPFEKFNRRSYSFNISLYKYFLKPITRIYQTITPKWGQNRVTDFTNNLSHPLRVVNSALQGNFKSAMQNFWRFTINCTLGIGGLFDIASELGLPNKPANFDLTFAHYNGNPGPYVMIPIVGPSTARGAFGLVLDIILDPLNYFFNDYQVIGRYAIRILDTTNNNMSLIEHINKTALDPYIMTRSFYIQNLLQGKNILQYNNDVKENKI